VYRVGDITLVVSRGTGTTLVPFRLLARPEASLLRLTAG
jgi:predicted MPP superfamily phosphohydrolase